MDIARFDPAQAQPFDGGNRAVSSPPVEGSGTTLHVLQLEQRGETGRRVAPFPVALVVVAGEGQLRVGGEIAEVQAGDAIAVPPNTTYWVWTTESTMTLVLIECT